LSGYLVDTSILSVLAPGRIDTLPDSSAEWFREEGYQLYISSMSVAEIEKGIAKLRRTGSAKRAADLAMWLDAIEAGYDEHVLPFDRQVARLAGRMDDAVTAKGRNPGLADIIIAATAKAHDLTILTANERHFEALHVRYMNPFERLAE
jgi:predicted nucleic acid-binding protein